MTDTSPERAVQPAAVLVGPPGAGKSSVGRRVATSCGLTFTDVDQVIETEAGRSISDLFTQDGEAAFRRIEESTIARALSTVTGVLALGGGAVLSAATRQRLRGHGVVFLNVGMAEGVRRTGLSTARPLLAGVNPRATYKSLLDARLPLYREVATAEISTDQRDVDDVADAVINALSLRPHVESRG